MYPRAPFLTPCRRAERLRKIEKCRTAGIFTEADARTRTGTGSTRCFRSRPMRPAFATGCARRTTQSVPSWYYVAPRSTAEGPNARRKILFTDETTRGNLDTTVVVAASRPTDCTTQGTRALHGQDLPRSSLRRPGRGARRWTRKRRPSRSLSHSVPNLSRTFCSRPRGSY